MEDIEAPPTPDEEHLIIRKLPNISEEQYYQKQKEITNKEMVSKLYNYLKTINCNFKSPSSGTSVGGISPLTYLVEMIFHVNKEKLKEMYEKYDILKKYIHYYRTIKLDGNCFYRAVMFRYLEILILNKNITILQKITFDIIESFNSEELKKRRIINNEDIKPDLTFKILFLIVDLLKNNMVSEAHQILFKCFLTCQKFEYAIILYFRHILYEYIKKNENKIILKSFLIKIGNLLPSQFEGKNGEFLFNDFYDKNLLNFNTDAEKIIIYLTPFVLGIELNVVVFDINESTSDIFQKLVCEGESEIKSDDVISLINIKKHYEIFYTKKDEEKNKQFFQIFENNIKPILITSEINNNITQNKQKQNLHNLKCKKCLKDIQLINKEKIYCESCSKQNLYNYFLNYIQNNKDPIITFIDKFNNNKNFNDYLNIYNTNFNNKLEKNVIINNIKNKICFFGESGNKYYKLPCNCNLCSHLNDYFKQFNFNNRFICKCGVCYSRNDMIKLGVFFKKKNQDISKKISKYFQERTTNNCCICGTRLPNTNHFFNRPLSSSSYKILNVNENSLNDFINTYRHYICGQCKKKYTKKEFKCQICEINHL